MAKRILKTSDRTIVEKDHRIAEYIAREYKITTESARKVVKDLRCLIQTDKSAKKVLDRFTKMAELGGAE